MSLPCSSYGTNYSGTCTLFQILLAFDPAILSDQELDGTEAWVTDDEQRIKRASKNCKRNATVFQTLVVRFTAGLISSVNMLSSFLK